MTDQHKFQEMQVQKGGQGSLVFNTLDEINRIKDKKNNFYELISQKAYSNNGSYIHNENEDRSTYKTISTNRTTVKKDNTPPSVLS